VHGVLAGPALAGVLQDDWSIPVPAGLAASGDIRVAGGVRRRRADAACLWTAKIFRLHADYILGLFVSGKSKKTVTLSPSFKGGGFGKEIRV